MLCQVVRQGGYEVEPDTDIGPSQTIRIRDAWSNSEIVITQFVEQNALILLFTILSGLSAAYL